MSDLTKRLLDAGLILSQRSFRDQCGGPDCALSANLANEAADRIDALEECLWELAQCNVGPNGYYSYPLRDLRDKARALLEGK